MKRILAIAVVALMGVTALSAQTRMLAHRGGKAEQDENTLAAFKATYAAGCHGFETDIHITADGKYVIMHDGLLDRTTTGSGRVEHLSSAYIRTITTKGGEPVPFLEDLLDFFKDCEGLYVEFEMKTNQEFYPEELLHKYCEDVYSMVTAAKPKDALFVFTSFDPRPLLYLRAHHPDAEVMYITGKPCSHETVDLCKALGINRLAGERQVRPPERPAGKPLARREMRRLPHGLPHGFRLPLQRHPSGVDAVHQRQQSAYTVLIIFTRIFSF